MADHSFLANQALGKCTICGDMVVFAPGSFKATCGKCCAIQHRGSTDAADAYARRAGYIPGATVRPQWSR